MNDDLICYAWFDVTCVFDISLDSDFESVGCYDFLEVRYAEKKAWGFDDIRWPFVNGEI